MAVLFTHKRLLVGKRWKDWSDVWYEPVHEPDEEGEAEIGLYARTTGKPGRREPMEGEVCWFPEFDPKYYEATTKSTTDRMQKQFLTDAHQYLAEDNLERVRDMEEELDAPNYTRRHCWFQHAKKYKRRQMKDRERRQKRRTETASELRQAGISEEEIQKGFNSDLSDDSAYETDEEERQKRRAKCSARDMPPPKTKPMKRKDPSKKSVAGKKAPKKQKLSQSSNKINSIRDDDLFVSGGLGSPDVVGDRDPSRDSSIGGRLVYDTVELGSNSVEEADGEEDDDPSEPDIMMDTTDPNERRSTQPPPPPQPPTVGYAQQMWNFQNITPVTLRVRGRSVGNASYSRQSTPRTNGGNSQQTLQQPAAEENGEMDLAERARRHIREQSVLGLDDDEAMEVARQQSEEHNTQRETVEQHGPVEEQASYNEVDGKKEETDF